MSRLTTARPLAPPVARPPLRRWAWRLALVAWLALTVYLAYAKWGTWPRLQAKVLIAQRSCLTFAEPAGRVVFDADSQRAALLLKAGGYRSLRLRRDEPEQGAQEAPVVSTAAEERVNQFLGSRDCLEHWQLLRNPPPVPSAPMIWNPPTYHSFTTTSFYELPNDSLILFVHRLQSTQGGGRLVVLRADWFEQDGLLSLDAEVLLPTSLLGTAATLSQGRQEGRLDLHSAAALGFPLRLFAAQPDPTDSSRFTLDYEQGVRRGTIEGRLRSDDTVELRILSGPASE